MIRLETLHIRKLGNVAPDTKLHFGKRGSLLIGKNGTGKTTLLNIIVASLSTNWGYLQSLGNGFDLTYALTVEPRGLPALRLDVTMQKAARVEDRSPTSHVIDLLTPSGQLTVSVSRDEQPMVTIGIKGNLITWNQPGGDKQEQAPAPPATLPAALFFSNERGEFAFIDAQTYALEIIRKIGSISRLDEALITFEGLTEDYLGPNELVKFQFEEGSRIIDGASDHISAALLRAFVEEQQQSSSNIFSEERIRSVLLADSTARPQSWLADFCRFCNFQEAKLYLSLISSSEGFTEATYGPLTISYKTNGKMLSDRHLSFGQKRLFAALHHFDANPDILVADELVNGMHHRWIGYCVEQLEHRQAFLANQNPLLFDFWPFESVEDVAACFIECRVDEEGRFAWRNMPRTEAHEFYATYLGGIQHVSSILFTRGYW